MRDRFIVGYKSPTLPPGASQAFEIYTGVDAVLERLVVPVEIGDSFHVKTLRIGAQNILAGTISASAFCVREKSELEKKAEEIEALLDELDEKDDDLPPNFWQSIYELLVLIPRQDESPLFNYAVSRGTPISFEVENVSDEPKVFTCSIWARERG